MAAQLSNESPRALLQSLFETAVDAAHPRTVLPGQLPQGVPAGRNIVLGAGKAAASMAAVAADLLEGETGGMVVTRYGHAEDCDTGAIEVVEASHPVPDQNSARAAGNMLALAASASSEDRVIFLFSGGGSALLCAPIDGVSAVTKRDVTRFLLHSGAAIDEINLVRKHLSTIKGGGLASRAGQAELYTIIISDVVGDDPSDVASGPSIDMRRNAADALALLERYGYPGLEDLRAPLSAIVQRPVKDHPVSVAASASTALAAIEEAAGGAGWTVVNLGDDIEGDATEVGKRHADLALSRRNAGEPCVLISGGELTVHVKNSDGRGGPNLEYLTSVMLTLDGAKEIFAIACDSDGIDGSEDNAGGFIAPDSLDRAKSKNIDMARLLDSNNTYDGFAALGDLVVSGPTQTNVNDIRIILVNPTDEVHERA